ncbi:MAG: hypothetical protein A4E74_01548 [Syntrophus sp. PtaB.Bin075]|nr:MAG: hypothetical protein A4E74_01548 [Syntrophus sp. PtaB.Bin075]
MNSGPATDIITGMPVEKVAAEREAEARAREELTLKQKAEFLGFARRLDGKKLIDLIQHYLFRRIDELVKNDPQAQAYITLLTDIGVKENQAEKAAARLTAMKTGRE